MRRVVVRVIAGLLAAVALPTIAATDARNVLVLYSNGRLLPGNVEGDRGLHQAVRSPADLIARLSSFLLLCIGLQIAWNRVSTLVRGL